MNRDKFDGGAGLHDLQLGNIAFGVDLSWKMYTCPTSLWVHIIKLKYLDSQNSNWILPITNPPLG